MNSTGPIVLASVLAVAVLVVGVGCGGESKPAGPLTVSLDMNPEAEDLQMGRTLNHPETFTVDVVVENVPRPIAGIDIELIYDQEVIDAVEVEDASPGTDDNPDFNEDFLGSSGWDCTALGVSFPTGDSDGDHEGETGTAKIGCYNGQGPWPGEGDGVLATITFETVGLLGDGWLRLQNFALSDSKAVELGSCNPPLSYEITCEDGAVLVK